MGAIFGKACTVSMFKKCLGNISYFLGGLKGRGVVLREKVSSSYFEKFLFFVYV